MAMQRWDPWGELEDMERRMGDWMRLPTRAWRRPLTWWRAPVREVAWLPPVEVYEKGDDVMVRAELPGMKKEDIDISVLGDTLTISGERKSQSEVKDEDYYRCEMNYGTFSRSVALPAAVDANKVEASYDNGVLEVKLPKAEEAKPKKIEVKVK